LSNLFGGAAKINDYFADAVWVYMRTADPVVHLAALTAAKIAAGKQRASMVNYLRIAAADTRALNSSDDIAYRLDQLVDEISLRDWTIGDSTDAKQALWKLDTEYGNALDKFDGSVFRRRFPNLFRDGTRSASLEKPAPEIIKQLRAELIKSGPLNPDEEELLRSPGKLRDLLKLPDDVMQIIGEYGKVLAKDQRLVRPISLLPYPKDIIKKAIETALQYAEDREIRRHLHAVLFALDDFVPDEKVPDDPEENFKAWWDILQARRHEAKKG
jgi:hypothetical protein